MHRRDAAVRLHKKTIKMLTKRIIPCLDIKNGRTVKGVNFVDLRDAGDPVELAKIYSDEGADELVFLDISAKSSRISTECKNPFSPTARSIEILRAPDPTPASKTLIPGFISAIPIIIAASLG